MLTNCSPSVCRNNAKSSFCALSANYENDGSNDNVLPTTNMSYFEVWLFCVSFPLLSFEDTLQYERISLLQITFRSAQNQQSLQISSALKSLLIFIPLSYSASLHFDRMHRRRGKEEKATHKKQLVASQVETNNPSLVRTKDQDGKLLETNDQIYSLGFEGDPSDSDPGYEVRKIELNSWFSNKVYLT